MRRDFFRKQGIITTNLARDILSLEVGDRIPTISAYSEKLSVSRGVVQNSIAFLQNKNCIAIHKGGKNGSTLTAVNLEELQQYTGWDTLTGTMPVPLNDSLMSLSSAFYHEMGKFPLPFSFAYVTGSKNRIKQLTRMSYDFVIVSCLSAKKHLEQNSSLELVMVLDGCLYSSPYYLFFLNPQDAEIRDGMKVAIDYACTDQAYLTNMLCAGKDVTVIEIPYTAFNSDLERNDVDFFVYRQEKWINKDNCFRRVPISIDGYSTEEVVMPAILINKNNYGLKKLLQKHFSTKSMADVQNSILNHKLPMTFY